MSSYLQNNALSWIPAVDALLYKAIYLCYVSSNNQVFLLLIYLGLHLDKMWYIFSTSCSHKHSFTVLNCDPTQSPFLLICINPTLRPVANNCLLKHLWKMSLPLDINLWIRSLPKCTQTFLLAYHSTWGNSCKMCARYWLSWRWMGQVANVVNKNRKSPFWHLETLTSKKNSTLPD